MGEAMKEVGVWFCTPEARALAEARRRFRHRARTIADAARRARQALTGAPDHGE